MSPKKPRHRQPREDEWVRAFHMALCVVEDDILPLTDEQFHDSGLHQEAARGALGRMRTAAQNLTRETLGKMPEVVRRFATSLSTSTR